MRGSGDIVMSSYVAYHCLNLWLHGKGRRHDILMSDKASVLAEIEQLAAQFVASEVVPMQDVHGDLVAGLETRCIFWKFHVSTQALFVLPQALFVLPITLALNVHTTTPSLPALAVRRRLPVGGLRGGAERLDARGIHAA